MNYDDIKHRVSIEGDQTFKSKVEEALRYIYEGSPLAAYSIDAWLNNNSTNIRIVFQSQQAGAIPGQGIIAIDPDYFVGNYYISKRGDAVADTLVSGLAHELGHAISGKYDNNRYTNAAGENVALVNDWFFQLGIERQVSYQAYESQMGPPGPNPTVLIPGYNYTNGSGIAAAWIDQGSNVRAGDYDISGVTFDTTNLDLKAQGAVGRSLLIGSEAANQYGGTTAGDFIYGQGGSDTLRGYEGDDHLLGGTGDDYLYGGLNKDFLEGGDGSDYLYGEGGSDTLSGYLDSQFGLVFVDDGDIDFLFGGDGSDVLRGYGADRLDGGAQSDYLAIENPNGAILTGGTGGDVFEIITSAGYAGVNVRISDSDQADALFVNGVGLSGGTGWDPGGGWEPEYVIDEAGNEYNWNKQTNVLSISLAGGLGSIVIDGYRQRDLGISLLENPHLVAPDSPHIGFVGDEYRAAFGSIYPLSTPESLSLLV
ncbi:calcium-binding protein [Sphingomonas mucosissima]|uniref:Hemolysin, plasmid n=1 Tax=Sphingomonas mucosissima TaxID=370959 RepID=A0A245ZFU8_9SPHN|nr:calcium-binding protein [Sphingomonas mucosissima]OWK28606.1 hemolysin, plasmid [Sphingomonas mucosissima]